MIFFLYFFFVVFILNKRCGENGIEFFVRVFFFVSSLYLYSQHSLWNEGKKKNRFRWYEWMDRWMNERNVTKTKHKICSFNPAAHRKSTKVQIFNHKPNWKTIKFFEKEINYLFVNNYESTCSNCLHIPIWWYRTKKKIIFFSQFSWVYYIVITLCLVCLGNKIIKFWKRKTLIFIVSFVQCVCDNSSSSIFAYCFICKYTKEKQINCMRDVNLTINNDDKIYFGYMKRIDKLGMGPT